MSEVLIKNAHIQLLPPQLANQIAAGEVVERPASVVKELIENSIDAQADSIYIDIEQGGHKRILIRDTGLGIAHEQLTLALSRHATSKIRDIEDLERISSMGFRGEALASISSVSRLTLTSKPEEQGQAWQAKAEGIDMDVTLNPAAHPKGTSIEVEDLFFNTPARRKFLRAPKTEFQHIDAIVRRVALAHPKIAFVLKHNGKLVHKWAAGNLVSRVSAVCGAAYLAQTTELDYRHDNMHLSGWCSKIGEGFQTNDQQFIFVNQRMIRDKLVTHAIRQAYEGMLPDNLYPAYVLFLSLPAHDMDINVHPAKHEVRFHQARQVHDLIFQAISQAIVTAQALSEKGQDSSPDLTHDYIIPLQMKVPSQSKTDNTPVAQSSARLQSSSAGVKTKRGDSRYFSAEQQKHIAEAGERYQELMQRADKKQHAQRDSNDIQVGESYAYETHIKNGQREITFMSIGNYVLFQKQREAIVLPISLVLRLNFENDIARASISQPLLMPISVSHDSVSQESAIIQLRAIGCIVESRNQKYILKQVPSAIRALPWAHIFVRLLEQTDALKSQSECLTMIAQYYTEVSELSHFTVQCILAKIEPEVLNECLQTQGHRLDEATLLTLLEQH